MHKVKFAAKRKSLESQNEITIQAWQNCKGFVKCNGNKNVYISMKQT